MVQQQSFSFQNVLDLIYSKVHVDTFYTALSNPLSSVNSSASASAVSPNTLKQKTVSKSVLSSESSKKPSFSGVKIGLDIVCEGISVEKIGDLLDVMLYNTTDKMVHGKIAIIMGHILSDKRAKIFLPKIVTLSMYFFLHFHSNILAIPQLSMLPYSVTFFSQVERDIYPYNQDPVNLVKQV